MRLSLATLLMLWLACARALAQEGAACATDDPDCTCAADGTCWAFERLYSGANTLVGLRGTLSSVGLGTRRAFEGGALTAFATERYVTHREWSGHVAVSGAIGGGTAGTEGSFALGIDFGWRGAMSATSGPILRVGPSAFVVGNDRLGLSLFEPLQGRAGFQLLDRGMLVEGGLTAGLVGLGRYDPGLGASTNLARSVEAGSYFAAHLGPLRFDTSFTYLPEGLTRGAVPLGIARLALCASADYIVFCGDFTYANARTPTRRDGSRQPGLLYSGLTIGLSP